LLFKAKINHFFPFFPFFFFSFSITRRGTLNPESLRSSLSWAVRNYLSSNSGFFNLISSINARLIPGTDVKSKNLNWGSSFTKSFKLISVSSVHLFSSKWLMFLQFAKMLYSPPSPTFVIDSFNVVNMIKPGVIGGKYSPVLKWTSPYVSHLTP
jgi:hypothetical protein